MEEVLDVVNEKDQFVRKASRKEVREKALMYRVSRVIILNKEKKFLVQKRSMQKDIYPGQWDIGVAGTVSSGDGYAGTAMRELMEELGIVGISNIQLMHSFLFKIKHHSLEDNSICKVYKLNYDEKLVMQREEIEEIKFLAAGEVKKLIAEEPFHPVGAIIFKKYLELKNKN
ncbi:MAG: NUDIX domain-containing protein [Nanoarchaeota archaeon]